MNKLLLVVSLLVSGAVLNAGSGCSSCPGTKTTTRTSSCPSGTCGSKTVSEPTKAPESKTVPATPAAEDEVTVAEDAE